MQRIHVKTLRGSDTAKSVQSRIVTRYPCPNPDTETASAQRRHERLASGIIQRGSAHEYDNLAASYDGSTLL